MNKCFKTLLVGVAGIVCSTFPIQSVFAQSWVGTDFQFTNTTGGTNWWADTYLTFTCPAGYTPVGQNYYDGIITNSLNSYMNADSNNTGWESISLATLAGNTTTPTMHLSDFAGSRLYISYGGPISQKDYTTTNVIQPFALMEFSISGFVPATNPNQTFSPNLDISYVNSASLGVSATFYTTNGSGGYVANPYAASTANPLSTSNNFASNIKNTLNTVGGFGSTTPFITNNYGLVVQAPQDAITAYHDWSGLFNTLVSSSTSLTISNMTAPADSSLPHGIAGVPFGYVGSPYTNYYGNSNINTSYTTGQGYSATATFTNNLNANNDAYLNNLGISNGMAGMIISGYGTNTGIPANSAGNYTIYVTLNGTSSTNYTTNNSIVTTNVIHLDGLNGQNGIYGANPGYTIIGTNFTGGTNTFGISTTGILNDLSGRVVGDVMAGMTFGWANSTKTVYSWAASVGISIAQLNAIGITSSSTTMQQVSTGDLFYLLSLAAAYGNYGLAIGNNLDTNSLNYDTYTYAVAQNTTGYGSAFGDRIAGLGNPNPSWYMTSGTNNPPAYLGVTNYIVPSYIGITIDTVQSVPEPSTVFLLGIGAIAVVVAYRRTHRA